MLEVDEKVEGISGRDNICHIQPYEIVEIVPEEPESPEEPQSTLPKPPKEITMRSVLNWIIAILEWAKRKLL